MTTLELLLTVLITVWMGLLTLVVVLLVRQMSLLTVRVSAASNRAELENDGPAIGSQLHERIRATVNGAGVPTLIMVMSATCKPCHDLVDSIDPRSWPTQTLAVITGPDGSAGDLARQMPANARLLTGNEARDAAGLLAISSLPFGLLVQDGMVFDKGYLSNRVDLERLLHRVSHPHEFAQQASVGGNSVGN
jgi:hypothetical protein